MAKNASTSSSEVYIVDGARTPFLKAKGVPGPFAAADLGVACGNALLTGMPFEPERLDEVVMGCVIPSPDEANIARIMALRLGCGDKVPAWTVQRNCASGLQAIDTAYQQIVLDRSQLVLCGGTEAMSRAPLMYPPIMAKWLGKWMRSKTLMEKLPLLPKLRPSYFAPIISLLRGLRDPVCNLGMGHTAENIAYDLGITREEMDQFANESHLRLANAIDNGHLSDEVVPVYDSRGNVYEFDDGVRRNSTLERLAKMRPYFDKKYGMVTAANSSQVTDGAAVLLLANEQMVKEYNLQPLGRIVGCSWSALDPKVMGLGPVHAINDVLQETKLNVSDIDYWEINEAFATQVLGCVKALADETYCQEHLNRDSAVGEIDLAKLNVDGGGISIGHPIGASGARIVLHLLHVLKREKAKRGVASLCIGGGQGGAMVIERV